MIHTWNLMLQLDKPLNTNFESASKSYLLGIDWRNKAWEEWTVIKTESPGAETNSMLFIVTNIDFIFCIKKSLFI